MIILYKFTSGRKKQYSIAILIQYLSESVFLFSDFTISWRRTNLKKIKVHTQTKSLKNACVLKHVHFEFFHRLPDRKLIGGVSMWKKEDFEKVNGWSNLFVNWGGEDDDMSYRCYFY